MEKLGDVPDTDLTRLQECGGAVQRETVDCPHTITPCNATIMNTPKLQRWIDVLAALLGHHQPMTFTELAQYVPAYLADGSVSGGDASATVKRMFERDKLELREQGVPIESVGEDGSEESAYTIRARDFYLPYLGIVSARGFELPPMVDRYGYRSLVKLAFEPDELEAIVAASRRIMQIGDSRLSEIARSAIRKLAFDLPMGATDGQGDNVLSKRAAGDNSRALALLDDALVRRKQVSFACQSMAAGESTERHGEPYGLFFTGSHWYLVARDMQRDALRNFRVSRMTGLQLNASKPLTADYEIPPEFSLKQHAQSRNAWELGDHDECVATVDFHGQSGATIAAAALGIPDDGTVTYRQFKVRRLDSFVRWLLAFAGEATPVAPAELVGEYARLVRETRAMYAAKQA